jgi:hypothetical protein
MSYVPVAIYIQIFPEDAIRSGADRAGLLRIEVTRQWLQGLDDRERDKLVRLSPFTEKFPLIDAKFLSNPQSLDDITAYLQALIRCDDEEARLAAEKQAADDQGSLAAIKDWLQQPDEDRLFTPFGRSDCTVKTAVSDYRPIKISAALSDLDPVTLGAYRAEIERLGAIAADRTHENFAEKQRARQRLERKDAEKKQAEEEKRKAYELSRADWIAQHGSMRLQALQEEGFPLDKTYRDERLVSECPGFDWFHAMCGGLRGVRNPELDTIKTLRRFRKRFPEYNIRLHWLCDSNHITGCTHDSGESFQTGPVLCADFLGEIIVRRLWD